MAHPLKDVLAEVLGRNSAMISVVKSVEGVMLPEHIMREDDATVNLRLSFHFGDDLPVTLLDHGVMARLTFRGQVCDCYVPYKAIAHVREVEPLTPARHGLFRDTPPSDRPSYPEPGTVLRRKGHLTLIQGGRV